MVEEIPKTYQGVDRRDFLRMSGGTLALLSTSPFISAFFSSDTDVVIKNFGKNIEEKVTLKYDGKKVAKTDFSITSSERIGDKIVLDWSIITGEMPKESGFTKGSPDNFLTAEIPVREFPAGIIYPRGVRPEIYQRFFLCGKRSMGWQTDGRPYKVRSEKEMKLEKLEELFSEGENQKEIKRGQELAKKIRKKISEPDYYRWASIPFLGMMGWGQMYDLEHAITARSFNLSAETNWMRKEKGNIYVILSNPTIGRGGSYGEYQFEKTFVLKSSEIKSRFSEHFEDNNGPKIEAVD